MKSLAHEAVIHEISKKKDFSVRALGKKIGVNQSSLWHCIKGERKWNADKWLRTMLALDKAKIYGNKIVIETDAIEKYQKELSHNEAV